MVDRGARDRMSELLAGLASGEATNFAFEDAVPESSDPAITALADATWPFYDDFSEHALTGRFSLDASALALFQRMIAFLATDLEYSWWHPLFLDLLYIPLGLLSFGYVPCWIERLRHPRCFEDAWPFPHPDSVGLASAPLE